MMHCDISHWISLEIGEVNFGKNYLIITYQILQNSQNKSGAWNIMKSEKNWESKLAVKSESEKVKWKTLVSGSFS